MRYRSVGLSKADYFVVPVVELYFYRLLSEDGNMKKQWKKLLADACSGNLEGSFSVLSAII